MSGAAGSAGAWSKCGACGRCEYNTILVEKDRRCKCGRQVKLFKPKKTATADTLQSNQLKTVGAGKGSDTLASTEDPLFRKLLSDEIAKLEATQTKPLQSKEEVLRHASGVWRDASLKHDQAINAVVKAQDNLDKAQQREREMALALARAEAARRLAAQGMAMEMGLSSSESSTAQETDRAALKALEQELRSAQALMEVKHTEVKAWNEKMSALKAKIDERLRKKRRQDGDAAAAGDGGALGGPCAPGATGASGGSAVAAPTAAAPGADGAVAVEAAAAEAQRVQEAADRISAAKLAAAQAAKQA
ncbi:unnamed protein product, partial [Prorocentrum cordatum]